jgi:glycosyltransferase involved in cell wall biosynthesis
MNLTLVSGIYPPDIGGPATYIPGLAQYLSESQENVRVISLTNGESCRVQNSWVTYLVSRKSRRIRRLINVMVSILKIETDVFFVNGMHEEVAIANIITRKPVIAKIVGDPVWERARNNGSKHLNIQAFNGSNMEWRHRLQRRLLTWSLNQFQTIICPSNELVSLVKSWGVRTPVQYLPNGVDPSKLELLNPSYEVVAISRLVTWKNLDLLIEASAKLGVRLAIAGEGPEEHKLKDLARNLGANVQFCGALNSGEVTQILRKGKAFALLSDYEGQSFALLHAMSLGIPPVVSDIEGNTQVVVDGFNGIVIDLKSQEMLTKKLEELLQSTELQRKLGANAKRTIELDFNLNTNYLEVHELLLDAL